MLGLHYDLMSLKFKHEEVGSDKGVPEEEIIANMTDVVEHECPVALGDVILWWLC